MIVSLLQTAARPQEVTLRGFVVRAETGQPLPGANVELRDVRGRQFPRGVAANGNGYYFSLGSLRTATPYA